MWTSSRARIVEIFSPIDCAVGNRSDVEGTCAPKNVVRAVKFGFAGAEV